MKGRGSLVGCEKREIHVKGHGQGQNEGEAEERAEEPRRKKEGRRGAGGRREEGTRVRTILDGHTSQQLRVQLPLTGCAF